MTFYQRVYCLVRRIPRGKVVSYGSIAAALGEVTRARGVGYALHLLPHDTDVPWHRVINSKASISIRGDDIRARVQLLRLTEEGVKFNESGKTDFAVFGYKFNEIDLNTCL